MPSAAFTLGWLTAVLLVSGGASAARQNTKGATIELRTKWPSTPLVMEAAEFLVRLSDLSTSVPSSLARTHPLACSMHSDCFEIKVL